MQEPSAFDQAKQSAEGGNAAPLEAPKYSFKPNARQKAEIGSDENTFWGFVKAKVKFYEQQREQAYSALQEAQGSKKPEAMAKSDDFPTFDALVDHYAGKAPVVDLSEQVQAQLSLHYWNACIRVIAQKIHWFDADFAQFVDHCNKKRDNYRERFWKGESERVGVYAVAYDDLLNSEIAKLNEFLVDGKIPPQH